MPQIDGLELTGSAEREEENVSSYAFLAPDGASLTIEDCSEELTEKKVQREGKAFLSRHRAAARAAQRYGMELAGHHRDSYPPDKPTDYYTFCVPDGSRIEICSDDIFTYRGESETAKAAEQARAIWEFRKVIKKLHRHPPKRAKGHRRPSPKPTQKRAEKGEIKA